MTEELNKAQAEAVDILDGPALVVAGAGTGKTRVITERILKLIEKGVPAENILALTFTEKAAGEMRDRVGDYGLKLSLDVPIYTFNGFGGELLRRFGVDYGLNSLKLVGEIGQLVFLREHFDELELDYFAPFSNPDGQLKALADYASLLKQQLVQPQAYIDYAKKLPSGDAAEKLEKTKHEELARFFEKYIELCRANQVIDYDDQVYLAIELLKARPNILKSLQEEYKFLLVDEFQDTNPMQSELIDLLTGKASNVMAVGDDDQSIYGFRGATVANILNFSERYPSARKITLIENYRSSQQILDAAYRLIQNNNPNRLEVIDNLDKKLLSKTNGSEPTLQNFAAFDEEVKWVADEIASRLKSGQSAGQIAVLARGRNTLEKVHEALEQKQIAHSVAGQKNDLYKQPAVLRLIEILKAVADPGDDLSLFHALAGPAFNVPHAQLAGLNSTSGREHRRLADIIGESKDEDCKNALLQLEKWRGKSANQSVRLLAFNIITDSGWAKKLYKDAEKQSDDYIQLQALGEYFETLREFEKASGLASVQSYVLSLPALLAAGSDFEDSSLDISDQIVNVMTIHSAKGLEWETVFIVDCVERSFPFLSGGRSLNVPEELQKVSSEADERLAEERRLMYVALTRAKKEVFLSYSARRGDSAVRKPSRFLGEIFDQVMEAKEADGKTASSIVPPLRAVSGQTVAPLPNNILKGDELILNASQIECWLNCPKDFYWRYVVGAFQEPSPLADYGTAIHEILKLIFDGRRKNNPPTYSSAENILNQSLSQSGYFSAGSRVKHHEQAAKSLKLIYERFMNEELPTQDEADFLVMIPEVPIKIKGRMDAIYERASGVEIRDFKTSSTIQTAKKAKERATSSAQLTVYALAWQLLHGELPKILSLDYVVTGQIGSVRKTDVSIKTMLAKLAEMNEQLRAGHYPLGRDHSYCSHPSVE